MRILITGANGQLGCDLQRTLASHELVLMDIPTFDLTKSSCEEQVASARPDVVIHAAAYTDVDGAEHQPDLAMAVNAQGTEWVARGTTRAKARLIYISTDYVFDGLKRTPYLESDLANPLNQYGKSKLEGERRALDRSPERSGGSNVMALRCPWQEFCEDDDATDNGAAGITRGGGSTRMSDERGRSRTIVSQDAYARHSGDCPRDWDRRLHLVRIGVCHRVGDGARDSRTSHYNR